MFARDTLNNHVVEVIDNLLIKYNFVLALWRCLFTATGISLSYFKT